MSKILAVDDDKHIRLLYSEELKEVGYEVITAECGYGLLETIEEEEPDLLILDVKMLDCDGLDLLQDIRNHFYDLPLIFATASDCCEDDIRSSAADFYLIKSFDLTELKEKIAMALGNRVHN